MRFEIPFFGKILKVSVVLYEPPKVVTSGLTNRTEDGYFIPFFDYDGVLLEAVKKEAKYFQKEYKLGPAIILASSENTKLDGSLFGNYHLIFFAKCKRKEIIEMLQDSMADPLFKERVMESDNRSLVLRSSPKVDLRTGEIKKPSPELVGFYPAKTNRELSRAHILFYSKMYDIPLSAFSDYKKDNSENVEVIRYFTR